MTSLMRVTVRATAELKLLDKVHHFNGRQGGFGSFIAGFAPGAIERLLHRRAGEDAEQHGNAALDAGPQDAGGHLVIDVFVVAGFALNDRPQAAYGRVFFALGQLVGHQRKLERPGNPDDGQIVVAGAMPAKCIECPVEQSPGDKIIEPGDDDGIALVAGDEFTFDD